MKNKPYSTLVLLVVLLILGSIAWWLITTQETALNKYQVLDLSKSDIIGFDITKEEEHVKEEMSIRLDSNNNWVITKPVKDITDPDTISIMFASLNNVTTPTIIKNVADLEEYGLDRPTLTVTILLKKEKPVTIDFGSESPIPEMYYACLNRSGNVVAIGKDIKNNLSPKLSYLRERKVVNLTEAQVRLLTIKTDQGQVFPMINTDGVWSLSGPYQKELSTEVIKEIINGLNALWTHENDDDLNNLVKYGLDQPDYQVDIKLSDGQSFSLSANKVNHDYYIHHSLRPTIFKQMNPDAFNFLKTSLQEISADNLGN